MHWRATIAAQRRFDLGWKKYEWRWKNEQLLRQQKRNFAQPLWLGSDDIAGKTILLHAEQGFGDTIQFCRYVPLVAERGARVILEVPRRLHELMGTLFGAAQIVSRGDPLPDFDIHCPLLSLPLAFGTQLETIPAATPYLRASPRALMDWDTRLGPKRHRRIGLAWSGSSAHTNDRNRSIRLSSLLSLLDVNATFVSLQKDVRTDDMTVLSSRDGAQRAHVGGGNRFGRFIEHDALDCVAHIAAIENIGDVGKRHDHETPSMRRKRGLDALLNRKERQRIFGVYPVRVTNRNARLSYSSQTFLDQALMTTVKRLVASDEKRRRLLRVERRPQPRQDLFSPILRRTLGTDAYIKMFGRRKHTVGVREATDFNAVKPYRESFTERSPGVSGRANKIGDHGPAGFDDAVAHPSHATGVLDAIFVAEAKVARKIGAHCIRIEHHRVEKRGKRIGKRRLAGARQTHD